VGKGIIELEADMKPVMTILTALAWSTTVAMAQPATETVKFAINRNGEQIGTHVIETQRKGPLTVVSSSTRVEVKVMFITAYHLEQDETEHWDAGHLVSISCVTNDNGTPHKLNAEAKGAVLQVIADGKTSQVDAGIVPNSLWNTAMIRQPVTLNVRDGSVMHITVADGGFDSITVRGRPAKAHHYSVKSAFPEELWYDEQGHLLQAQFKGSDGSTILYQLM
jgi:hypothetical protein